MGRPPIGKKAMTPAERQRRRRKSIVREAGQVANCLKRLKARDNEAKRYIPMPPGITYWETLGVQTADGPRDVLTPLSRPLAACSSMLTDDDVRSLLIQLRDMVTERGITDLTLPASCPAPPRYGSRTASSLDKLLLAPALPTN